VEQRRHHQRLGRPDSNGWNVLASYSHEELERITALQRDFSAKGAFFKFSANGKQYYFDQRTGNTEPANITFNARPKGSTADPVGYAINPYLAANGNCGSAGRPAGHAVPLQLRSHGGRCAGQPARQRPAERHAQDQ
jgi:hypothetical protein